MLNSDTGTWNLDIPVNSKMYNVNVANCTSVNVIEDINGVDSNENTNIVFTDKTLGVIQIDIGEMSSINSNGSDDYIFYVDKYTNELKIKRLFRTENGISDNASLI